MLFKTIQCEKERNGNKLLIKCVSFNQPILRLSPIKGFEIAKGSLEIAAHSVDHIFSLYFDYL